MKGLGIMINELSSNTETVEAVKSSIGKTIKSVECKDDVLKFVFSDATTLKISDGGQSCCEHRYMKTDDDLSTFNNSKLESIEVRDVGSSNPPEYGDDCTEVQFLVIQTSEGSFTVANYNEHNGYYGGFYMQAFTHQAVS